MPSRRTFLKGSIATGLAFGGLAALYGYRRIKADRYTPGEVGFGPLIEDPAGVLSLPKGFRYKILSTAGEDMADGLMLPGRPDAMATFPGSDGKVVAVRNHELTSGDTHLSPFGEDESRFSLVDPARLYDPGIAEGRQLGGTTTFVLDPKSREIEKQFLSLGGTQRNCAGGATPWGSWLTCEETTWLAGDDRQKDHGYIFEVPATAEVGLADPLPLVAMGRFQHEAAAVDPRTGIVYLTEDQRDSLFYRFLPDKPGELSAGGRLQALAVKDRKSLDTTNHQTQTVSVGQAMEAYWVDLDDPESKDDSLRARGRADGAAVFVRGEGMWYGHDGIYFVSTTGGSLQIGQIWHYLPGPHEGTSGEVDVPGRLSLFVEPNDPSLMDMADNITVAPWGDLIVCEDGNLSDHVRGVTPEGKLYTLARNEASHSEFAGACFTPDGETLLVNMQTDQLTVAIWGPWDESI
jgi:secreted PhoX family phosphatase